MSQYNPVPPTMPGSVSNTGAGAPNTTLWLVLSILTTLFCCLPAGVAGIVYSALAMGRVGANDMAGAHKHIKSAKMWVIISAVLAAICIALYFALIFFGVVAAGGAAAAGSGMQP